MPLRREGLLEVLAIPSSKPISSCYPLACLHFVSGLLVLVVITLLSQDEVIEVVVKAEVVLSVPEVDCEFHRLFGLVWEHALLIKFSFIHEIVANSVFQAFIGIDEAYA